MLALLHSFSPLSSLHMGRSVGSPLEAPKDTLSFVDPSESHTKPSQRPLLVGVSGHGVPPLVLVHVHTPDVGLLVHLAGCRERIQTCFQACT